MRVRGPIAVVAAAALAVAGWYYYGGRSTPAGQPPLTTIDGEASEALRVQFNQAANQVRVVLLLSPT